MSAPLDFDDISGIHHTVQKIKYSTVRDELKKPILTHYNNLLLNLKVLGEECSDIPDCLKSDPISFFTNIINLTEKIEHYKLQLTRYIEQVKTENPHKFNKVAVIFVGHYRTFKMCLPNNLFFLNKLSNHIDYYFITWDKIDYTTSDYQRDGMLAVGNVDPNLDIQIYFGKSLKGMKIVNSDLLGVDLLDTNRRGLSKLINLTYLSKIGNSLKQLYEKEHNFVYDQVIEMRPDIVHYPDSYNHSNFFFNCSENDLVTDFSVYNLNSESNNLIGNWYWRMTSNTHDKFSQLHDFLLTRMHSTSKDYQSFHTSLTEYFMANSYIIRKGLDSLRTVHVKTSDDLTPI